MTSLLHSFEESTKFSSLTKNNPQIKFLIILSLEAKRVKYHQNVIFKVNFFDVKSFLNHSKKESIFEKL